MRKKIIRYAFFLLGFLFLATSGVYCLFLTINTGDVDPENYFKIGYEAPKLPWYTYLELIYGVIASGIVLFIIVSVLIIILDTLLGN